MRYKRFLYCSRLRDERTAWAAAGAKALLGNTARGVEIEAEAGSGEEAGGEAQS